MFFPTSPSLGGSESSIIKSDMTLSVPTDFDTIYDAVASFEGKAIAEGVMITVSVEAGVITHTAIQNFDILNIDMSKFELVGATGTDYAIQATGAAVVAAEDYGFNVSLGIADITGLAIDDYIVLQMYDPYGSVVGGSHSEEFCGMAKIISLEADNSESGITAFFPNRTVSEGAIVTGGTITKFNSVLNFTSCDGLRFGNSCFKRISNLAIIGNWNGVSDYSSFTIGFALSGKSYLIVPANTDFLKTIFSNFGIYGFAQFGLFLFGNAVLDGIVSISNCGEGLYVSGDSYFNGGLSASGNGYGIHLVSTSSADIFYLNTCGNSAGGVIAENKSNIELAFLANSKSNPTDIQALSGSSIELVYSFLDNYDTASPALNTVGNDNSYIKG